MKSWVTTRHVDKKKNESEGGERKVKARLRVAEVLRSTGKTELKRGGG